MFTEHLSYYQRPFDERLKEIALQREDGDGVSVIICVPNPDYKPIIYRNYDESLEQYQRLLGSTHEVKKPVEPQPGFQAVSDEAYQAILIDRGVIKAGSAGAVEKKDRVEDRVEKKAEVGGAGTVGGSSSQPANSQPNVLPETTAIKIYAKAIYGIPISQYTREKLVTAARKHLGIDNPKNLVPQADRINNFNKFVALYVYNGKANQKALAKYNSDLAKGVSPSFLTKPSLTYSKNINKSDPLYLKLKTYSETDYGSLMIKEFVDNQKKYNGFKCYLNSSGTAAANPKDPGDIGFVKFPKGFPTRTNFPGGESVDWLAIIHHEFGHTYGGGNYGGAVQDERTVTKDYDNSVRILNGEEPRYTYFDNNSKTTINIIDSTIIGNGKMTFDPNNPAKLIPRSSAQAKKWK